MAKIYEKRAFAFLTVLILAVCAFATFLVKGASADIYGSVASKITDVTDTKPPVKKTGSNGVYAAIADYDNCLTEAQENELLEILYESAKKIKANVGIVITRDLENYSDAKYSDVFSDEVFGYGTTSIVVMFLNRYGNPAYSRYVDQISTGGKLVSSYNKRKIQKTFDRVYDAMGDPRGDKNAYNTSTQTYGGYNFYSACKEFARCVKKYGVRGFAAIPGVITGYMAGNFMFFAGGIVIALLITLGVVKTKVNSYKRKAPISASNYMDRTATRVTRSVDQFVREYTTVTHHSSSSGGHGGGHSGGHSGGHGGGGGRGR